MTSDVDRFFFDMLFSGLLIGVATFLSLCIFHLLFGSKFFDDGKGDE